MASFYAKRGRLYIDFRWKGIRCQEATKRTDTRANRAALRRLVRQIDGEVAAGTFNYAKHFPNGRKRAVFSASTAPSAHIPPRFAVFTREWLEYRRPWLAAGTAYDYRRILERHLIPRLGERRVADIAQRDIEALVAALKQLPGSKAPLLSNRRVNMILAVLRVCLNSAVEQGLLTENPVTRLRPLKEERPDIDPFAFDEVKQLLAVMRPKAARYFTVAFFSGLRPTEQIGLQWDDVEWRTKVIRVRRGVSRFGGPGMPKTPGAYRDVAMVPIVERALREQCPTGQLESRWVFPNEKAGPLNITNLRERVWKPALRRARLRMRTLYQTRHTFATLALSSGEDIGWVAKMLGHTTTEMLIRHYHRFIPNLTRRDGSALSRRLAEEGL